MKFGLQINRFDWARAPNIIGSKFAKIARTAEAAGFDGIWVMDHCWPDRPNARVAPHRRVLTVPIPKGKSPRVAGAFFVSLLN